MKKNIICLLFGYRFKECDLVPETDILKVIELIRDSFDGSVEVYTHGSCTKFAMILKYIFPDGEILSDHNHSIFEYNGNCYDITGFVKKTEEYKPITDWGIIKAYEWMNNKYKIKI